MSLGFGFSFSALQSLVVRGTMALKMEGVDPQQIRQLLERKRKEDLRGLLKAQQKGKLTE